MVSKNQKKQDAQTVHVQMTKAPSAEPTVIYPVITYAPDPGPKTVTYSIVEAPTILPRGDALAPETPEDAITRYVAILLRWEDLTARQIAYEADLAELDATGDKLRPEWEALAADRRACLAELQGLAVPLETVIARCWTMFKVHLAVLCKPESMVYGVHAPVPEAVRKLAKVHTLNPRVEDGPA